MLTRVAVEEPRRPDVSDEAARAEIAGRLAYSGSDIDTQERLVAVLVHLPEAVREFALERCSFASVSGDTPQGASESDRVLVVIEDGVDESGIRYAVGHAWLGRDTGGPSESVAVEEHAIRELVAQWEFTGPGADS
jgi:hypothetical protein